MTRSFRNRSRHLKTGGFLLLETLIGVAVFALGVLALARCVTYCLDAEIAKGQDQKARVLLENRMAEIEAGAVDVGEAKSENMKGMFSGITLKQSRKAFPYKDENKHELTGLFIVYLEADWKAPGGGTQSKALNFYVLQQK